MPDPRLPIDREPEHEAFPELRSERPIPAGVVLAIMLIGLLLGALLNAERLEERAQQKSFEDRWREPSTAVWGAAAAVSRAVGLDIPRDRLEAAIGRAEDGRSSIGLDELLAERGRDGPASEPDTIASTTTTTTTAPPTPTIRRPTADRPLRLYVGGDSMAKAFGLAMRSAAGSTGIIEPVIDYRVVSGLTRPDYFNWPQHLADDVVPTDPEVVILLFGANDAQGIETSDGVCRRFEQCWLDEYARRVAGTMDLLEDPDGDRIVLWLGQPIMGPTSGVDYVDLLNRVYAQEASTRPWVTYVDTWNWFADRDGAYGDYLPAADGSEHRVRDADHVHFTPAGGDRLSWALLRLVDAEVTSLSAWSGPFPSSSLPPVWARPRTGLPAPEPVIVD